MIFNSARAIPPLVIVVIFVGRRSHKGEVVNLLGVCSPPFLSFRPPQSQPCSQMYLLASIWRSRDEGGQAIKRVSQRSVEQSVHHALRRGLRQGLRPHVLFRSSPVSRFCTARMNWSFMSFVSVLEFEGILPQNSNCAKLPNE